ncbi:Rha family transcriptional regulator [Acinetobacter seifertii]|uniref:Rha family transcriptional regulator n=1 Tax=Acinetobacter seifertii TaxID=1530123 RepID=A0A7H2V912_9GAMM|nr:Rha family transcriptional regulator [Acinetobacter seifertii]QNX72845.1 Rha family transcriptional regulator [Acinetobacter seifertii]
MQTFSPLNHAVFIENQQIKTTSLKVAEIFGKQHKNVLQKLESLECSSEFTELNFQLSEYIDNSGRYLPMYEMTKDGFIFLVMGFTGSKAAQIKESYINAFNQMAVALQNQRVLGDELMVGATVQLMSSSPQLTISQLIKNVDGVIDQTEVLWFKQDKLYKEIIPISCLYPSSTSQILKDFWASIYSHGLEKLNHTRQVDFIALNISQLYSSLQNLPLRKELTKHLKLSKSPFPTFTDYQNPIRSCIDGKLYRCYVFRQTNLNLLSPDNRLKV